MGWYLSWCVFRQIAVALFNRSVRGVSRRCGSGPFHGPNIPRARIAQQPAKGASE
jgi:hypothetical protein